MGRTHEARIYWSAEQVRRGLPTVSQTIDPAWFVGVAIGTEDAWSLKCEFAAPPVLQGSPSLARVEFWMAAAPHDRLGPGTRLRLFERGTGQLADVEILT